MKISGLFSQYGVTLTELTWGGKIGLMLSFWQFWLASLKTGLGQSWKIFGHARGVAAVLLALVALGSSIAWIVNEKSKISAWLTVGPVVLLVLFWVGFTFRGAYTIYCQCYPLEASRSFNNEADKALAGSIRGMKDRIRQLKHLDYKLYDNQRRSKIDR